MQPRRKLAAAIGAAIAMAAIAPASAEVWMVKPSGGTIGCKERTATVTLGEAQSMAKEPPAGCVLLHSGERLLDQPEIGVGFNGVLRVQRHDGTMLYVSASAVVVDPGIGSLSGDRGE